MAEQRLPTGYSIREMSWEQLSPLFFEKRPKLFGKALVYPWQRAASEKELEKYDAMRERYPNPFRICLGLFYEEDLVGWCFGVQKDASHFYMTNSAVEVAHRRLGLYSALLERTLEIALAEGFQIIFSRHTATNNAILIPKLQRGFIISGMEISDEFGLLLQLRYYANPKRRHMMDVRSGESLPDEETQRLLGLGN